MVFRVRAVYENGHLRLLDLVTLREGEEINIEVTRNSAKSEEDARIQTVLGDALIWNHPELDTDAEIEALQSELDQTIQRVGKTASEIIIEEREQGN